MSESLGVERLGSAGRLTQVAALVVITVALIGFVTGTRGGAPEPDWGPPPDAVVVAAPLAPSYDQLGGNGWSWTAERQRTALVAMQGAPRGLTDEVPAASDAEVAAAVARRMERRSYDGAPPRIPHPVPQLAALPCEQCHAEGLKVGPHAAMPRSHRALSSCLQCHVVDAAPMPGADRALDNGPPIDNGFVGLEPPPGGRRALPGAPPTVPHPLEMRDNCVACHGTWATGLRSTHPWRQSCTQCHALDAGRRHP